MNNNLVFFSRPGELNGQSKLTADQVMEIRTRVKAGEVARRLAVEFGISYCNISKIINGHAWTHVGGPIKKRGQFGRYGKEYQ